MFLPLNKAITLRKQSILSDIRFDSDATRVHVIRGMVDKFCNSSSTLFNEQSKQQLQRFISFYLHSFGQNKAHGDLSGYLQGGLALALYFVPRTPHVRL